MSEEKLFENADRSSIKFPKPDVIFSYGTAGFRLNCQLLPSVMYRMGLLAVARSRSLGGQTIGMMITASHNPVQDNGVKLVDPLGEMLEAKWEKYATQLANTDNIEQCLREITKEVKSNNYSNVGNVLLARDTRPSGQTLLSAAVEGIQAFGGKYENLDILTTPQLHFIVRCVNNPSYGVPSEQGYYQKISKAFTTLTNNCATKMTCINVDGANGVGALKVLELSKHLGSRLPIKIFNDGSNGELNKNCGADYVKVAQKYPQGMVFGAGDKGASMDGDADRLVYFYQDDHGIFHLLDGDKISTLFAGYLKEKLMQSGLHLEKGLGLVQTAYANGSSTSYVKDILQIPVSCVKTGVKHLHRQAQAYDIGVYFEANGHGTLLFSEQFKANLHDALKDQTTLTAERKAALIDLQCCMNLINETVGDALTDLLFVEVILFKKQWSLKDWDSCYKDLPNRQRKVKVKDRTAISTTNAEQQTTSPEGLQAEIDKIVSSFNKGRSFVRPSGTEDVVRVYAEAGTQEAADQLALQVSRKVYELAGGIGETPI